MKMRDAWISKAGLLAAALLAACGPGQQAAAPAPVEVTVQAVSPGDVPVAFLYAAQTESSRLVEIRAQVEGYLEKKFFSEGGIVREGDPLFRIDPRPLQAVADGAAAALAEKENGLAKTRRTRERLQALLAENAVSQKDVEDAVAAEQAAAAALAMSRAEHTKATMNLSYAYIKSPLKGLVSRANIAEGSYVTPGAASLLTTVAQVDPIWVNFSTSENEWLRFNDDILGGRLRFPENFDFDVEMVLGDGRTLSTRGKINFAAPSVDARTGAYAIRASFPNPDLIVRPGQFVRVRLLGAWRPGAILVPQRAVMQGEAGKFVYVVGAGDRAERRPVEVGDWHEDQWFINAGLKGGERIVVGGVVKVQPGSALRVAGDAGAAEPPK
ncbi:MAG: efflux RND transporter periplasmic adaptor subunit [Rhodocyclaceae bacterium]|nr:efflux RND transporter periplasmic adaptor subunit [Rhodocyclaceae bacterium]